MAKGGDIMMIAGKHHSTRTALGFGLGLAALVSTYGIERATTNYYDLKHQHETLEQKYAALQQQVSHAVQEIAAVRNQSHALIAKTSQDAASDKNTAIAQVIAQLPTGHDPSISGQFRDLRASHPWLDKIRNGVGWFVSASTANHMSLFGTAELLDKHGSVVFCNHQIALKTGKNVSITFNPAPNSFHTVPVRIVAVEPREDIAFGTIPAKDVATLTHKFHVRPVKWDMSEAKTPASKDVIFVGFPQGIPRIHAVLGTDAGMAKGPVSGAVCKTIFTNVAFHGMSGGGAFRNGKFTGIINAASDPGEYAWAAYTPLRSIMIAYGQVFPERAAQAGITPSVVEKLSASVPAECNPKPMSYMTLTAR